MKPLILIDMDGVMTDFDNQFRNYSGLSPNEYISKYGDNTFHEFIAKLPMEFWSNMPTLKYGINIYKKLSKQYTVKILSAAFDTNENSIRGKLRWLYEYLGLSSISIDNTISPFYDGNIVILGNKYDFINKYNTLGYRKIILIDDFGKNCDEFLRYGGYAYKYTPGKDQLNDIIRYINYVDTL